jgi:hypothetical protein
MVQRRRDSINVPFALKTAARIVRDHGGDALADDLEYLADRLPGRVELTRLPLLPAPPEEPEP